MKITVPKWMPESYRAALFPKEEKRRSVTYRFSKAERSVIRRPSPLKPSDWCERFRVITESAIKGPWRKDVAPWTVSILDAMEHPAVETGILCKCVQSGGSETGHNLVGYWTDRKPGPVKYFFPDQKKGKEQLKKRVLTMFKASARLRRHLTGYENDEAGEELNLRHMTISIAWAGSPSSLASDPVRYLIFDETDKYPAFASKREADPISLGEARATTYRRRRRAKIFKLSTPTIESGYIWTALTKEAQVVFDYWVKCPECEQFHVMEFANLKWEGGREADAELVESEKLAWYECPKCEARWDDDLRDIASRAGEWRSRTKVPLEIFKYLDTFKPKKIGWHLPAWPSSFVSLSECAAAFLRGLTNKGRFRFFMNNYEALPWKTIVSETKADDILKAKCKLPPQVVPAEAVALTCWVDRQKVGFPFVVRAWARDYSSWLIHYGVLFTWEDLEDLLFSTWYPVEGTDIKTRIWRAAVDLGGGSYGEGDMTMTEETVMWLQRHMRGARGCRVWGTKGSSNPLPTMLKLGQPQNRTPSGKPLKYGFRNILLDTAKFKDLFHERLEMAEENLPGAAYLHSETGIDYANQIVAEVKKIDEKGQEVWEAVKKDNHYLDCEVGAAALAHWEWPGGGVHLLPVPDRTPQKVERPVEVKKSVNPFTEGETLFGGDV